MPGNQGYLLHEDTVRKLARDHERMRLEYATLKRHLANVSVRRHQVSFQPKQFIWFRNDTSEIVPRFAVMKMGETVYVNSTSSTYPVVPITKPDSTFQRRYLVNVGSAVPPPNPFEPGSQTFGRATMLEEAGRVLYDSATGTPALGECWGPSSGSWALRKHRYGFTILGANTKNTITFAVQEPVVEFRGKTNFAHAKGESKAVSIYDGNRVDTGDDLDDVLNDFANISAGNKVILVRWIGGRWCIAQAECPL